MVGCGTKLLRKDVASHMEAESHNYLLLVSTLCLRQREEFEQRLQLLQGQFHQRETEQKERHAEELQQLRKESELRVQQVQTQLYRKCEEIAEIQQKKHVQQKRESEQRLQQLQEQLHQKVEENASRKKNCLSRKESLSDGYSSLKDNFPRKMSRSLNSSKRVRNKLKKYSNC